MLRDRYKGRWRRRKEKKGAEEEKNTLGRGKK